MQYACTLHTRTYTVAHSLTSNPTGNPPLPHHFSSLPLPSLYQAARIVASRLCVPRDMGAPAAAALRAGLGSLALAHA